MRNLLLITGFSAQVLMSQVHAQQDVTSPGDPIIGGQMIGGVFTPATQGTPAGNANMFPSNGLPAFTIDDDLASKYRNFGEVMTGFIVTPRFGPLTFVTKIRFATAIDSPERDPLTYTLEGTTGDPLTGTYTLIASGSTGLDTDPGRGTFGPVLSFTGVGYATSYRVIFPTVRNSATADSMQVSEVVIAGVSAPEPSIVSLLGLSAIGLMGARRKRPAAV